MHFFNQKFQILMWLYLLILSFMNFVFLCPVYECLCQVIITFCIFSLIRKPMYFSGSEHCLNLCALSQSWGMVDDEGRWSPVWEATIHLYFDFGLDPTAEPKSGVSFLGCLKGADYIVAKSFSKGHGKPKRNIQTRKSEKIYNGCLWRRP